MKIKKWNLVFALTSAWLCSAEVYAQACEGMNVSLGPVIDAGFTRPRVFEWQGEFLQDDGICFLSRQSGAELKAYLFAPANIDTVADGALPVVVIGPGSGNGQALYYLWSARELAGHGYVALVTDPQGAGRSEVNGNCGVEGCPGIPFQLASNYVDGLQSGLDYVFSQEHPWLKKADLSRVGIAGHSLSARAASYVGGIDERVDAVVAWDNMSSDLHGDGGVSSGSRNCADLIGGEPPGSSVPVTIRVPTLGEASDAVGTCDPTNTSPEVKKTGYEAWRQGGAGVVAAMQLVFKGSSHLDWAQTAQSDPLQLESFEYYTRAWFDLYLKRDESARARLLAREVVGLPLDQQFSSDFRSAVFMPEVKIDCADLVAECVAGGAVAPSPPTSPGSPPASNNGSGLLLGALSWLQLLALMGFALAKTRHPLEALNGTKKQW